MPGKGSHCKLVEFIPHCPALRIHTCELTCRSGYSLIDEDLSALVDYSLLRIVMPDGILGMHDEMRDLGWALAQELRQIGKHAVCVVTMRELCCKKPLQRYVTFQSAHCFSCIIFGSHEWQFECIELLVTCDLFTFSGPQTRRHCVPILCSLI